MSDVVSPGSALAPQSRRQRVHNYSRIAPCHAEVFVLRQIEEAQALLAAAHRAGHKIAFRAAGDSLHDQAQGQPWIAQLAFPSELRLLGAACDQVEASATTTWRQVWEAASPHHRFPGVNPNTAMATLGGTLSANGLCQFSPLLGKEANGVLSIDLLNGSGESRTLSRPGSDASPEERLLFHSVIGGLGSLGLVVSVQHQLLAFPFEGPARVQSQVTATPDAEGLLKLLIDAHVARHRGAKAADERPWKGHGTLPGASPVGVIHTRGPACRIEKGLVPADAARDPYLLHGAKSWRGILGNMVVALPGVRARFWDNVHAAWRQRQAPYVDDMTDALFSMESNRIARKIMRGVGLDIMTPQQTFVLPIPDDGDLYAPSVGFVEAVMRGLRDHRLDASLIDVLTLPADEISLSSTRGMDGVAITVSLQQFGRRKLPQIKALLMSLSATCAALGGRVHLVKNVFAAPDVLQEMYKDGLAQWRQAKAILDPEGLFGSSFFARLGLE